MSKHVLLSFCDWFRLTRGALTGRRSKGFCQIKHGSTGCGAMEIIPSLPGGAKGGRVEGSGRGALRIVLGPKVILNCRRDSPVSTFKSGFIYQQTMTQIRSPACFTQIESLSNPTAMALSSRCCFWDQNKLKFIESMFDPT